MTLAPILSDGAVGPSSSNANGEPLASPDLVIIFKLPRHDNPTGSNVNVRGVTAKALEMRPYMKIVEGRMFRSGTSEVIVSRRLQQRLVDTELGDALKMGPRLWNVVGVFDAAGTSFDSEIWADLDYLGQVQLCGGTALPWQPTGDRTSIGPILRGTTDSQGPRGTTRSSSMGGTRCCAQVGSFGCAGRAGNDWESGVLLAARRGC